MIFLQREAGGAQLKFTGDAARVLKDGQVVVDWTAGGHIDHLPVGDGYTVEVRTGSLVTTDTLAVGVVVWTLGQSNMKGWFQEPAIPAQGAEHAYMFDSGNWAPVAGDGASAFAADLSASLGGVPIAFVDGSVNGSALYAANDGGLGYWENKSASLYPGALVELQAAGGKAELVLWNQGEADAAAVTASTYAAGVEALFQRVHANVPGSQVLIVGLAPARLDGQLGGYAQVRLGEMQAAADLGYVHYVGTDLDLELAVGPHLSGISRACRTPASSAPRASTAACTASGRWRSPSSCSGPWASSGTTRKSGRTGSCADSASSMPRSPSSSPMTAPSTAVTSAPLTAGL